MCVNVDFTLLRRPHYIITFVSINTINVVQDKEVTPSADAPPAMSPTRRRISNGIQSIMSKLNLSRGESLELSQVSD